MQTDMTVGSPIRVIVRFMIPLFLGNMFQQLYNMCDTVIVGHYVGANALAAVGSTGTIMFLVLGFAGGLTSGFTVITSQRFGARDVRGMKESVANAMLLAALVAILVTAVSLIFMKPLLTLMNTPAAIYDMAYAYISVICMGTVCSIAYNLFSAFLRAVGNSRMPLVFLIISAALNVALDLLFIIRFRMGVAGAAWATDVSQGISAVLCFLYILKKQKDLVPEKGMWHLHRQVTAHQLTVGVPMALQFAITASGTLVMQAAINLFGEVAVAAFTAANKVHNLVTQGMLSMGQASSTFAGQNIGAGKPARIKKGVHQSLLFMTGYSVIVGILVCILIRPALGLFFSGDTDISAMLPWARIYIYQSALFYIPLSFIFIFRNTMQGCGYGLLPMLGGVVELVCRVSVAVLAMHLMSYRLAVFCDPAAWIGAAIFTAIAYRYVMKKVYNTYSNTDQQEIQSEQQKG